MGSRTTQPDPPPHDPGTVLHAILRRWEHHTGARKERRSLYHKRTVLAVTAADGAQYVLKEVAKG